MFLILSLLHFQLHALPAQFSAWEKQCREIRESTSMYCEAGGCDIKEAAGVKVVAQALSDSQSIRDEIFLESKKLLHEKMSLQQMSDFLVMTSRECVVTLPRYWWLGLMATNQSVPQGIKKNFIKYLRSPSVSFVETMVAISLAKGAVDSEFIPFKNKKEVLRDLQNFMVSLKEKDQQAYDKFKGKVEGASWWQKLKIKIREGWSVLKGDFDSQMFWSEDYGLFLMEEDRLSEEGRAKLREIFPEPKN